MKSNFVKKDVYDKLVAKVNSKSKYDKDKSELENKILDTSGLVKRQIMILK